MASFKQIMRPEFLRGMVFYVFNKWRFSDLRFPVFVYNNVFFRNKKYAKVGRFVTFSSNAFISPLELTIGDFCWIGVNAFVCGKVKIGDHVMLGPNVVIPGAEHGTELSSVPMISQKSHSQGTVIGSNVWVGANTVILDGVRVGNNVVIGAGSIVVKDIPDNAIAVGSPAKVIKIRGV